MAVRGFASVFVGIVITMLIGIIVINALIGSVNQSGWSAQANQTWENFKSNIWVAYGLLVILPLVVGAVIILRIIGGGETGGL